MIMIINPFDTGDFVRTAGIAGLVDEMSVVTTRIRTFDNQIITVPNSKIWGDVITKVSASAERRVDLVFRIAYSDNTAQALKILSDLVAAHVKCLKDPEPQILLGALGSDSVNLFCRPWVKTNDYWVVYWELMAQAKREIRRSRYFDPTTTAPSAYCPKLDRSPVDQFRLTGRAHFGMHPTLLARSLLRGEVTRFNLLSLN